MQGFPSGFWRSLLMGFLQTGKDFMRSFCQSQESKNIYLKV